LQQQHSADDPLRIGDKLNRYSTAEVAPIAAENPVKDLSAGLRRIWSVKRAQKMHSAC